MVALESALITHGLPSPANLRITDRMTAAICAEGAVPAVVSVLDGRAMVGTPRDGVVQLASGGAATKISLRDLGLAVGRGLNGGTTVAASITLACRAGISVFATGGIGGVHRGHPEDISADIPALASTPIVVVCSGAKAILDLRRTREHLETCGVPVVGFRTDDFPAFYSRSSGLPVDARLDTPEDVAAVLRERVALGLRAALLVCVPVPESEEVGWDESEDLIARAIREADSQHVSGRDLTPFLLQKIDELSCGRARRANESLLESNAHVAGRIARAIARAR